MQEIKLHKIIRFSKIRSLLKYLLLSMFSKLHRCDRFAKIPLLTWPVDLLPNCRTWRVQANARTKYVSGLYGTWICHVLSVPEESRLVGRCSCTCKCQHLPLFMDEASAALIKASKCISNDIFWVSTYQQRNKQDKMKTHRYTYTQTSLIWAPKDQNGAGIRELNVTWNTACSCTCMLYMDIVMK